VVFNKSLSVSGVSTAGKNCNDSSLVKHSTLVSSDSRNVGGLPTTPSQQNRPGDSSNRVAIHNVLRSAYTNPMAHLRDSFTSQGLSGEASLCPGELKQTGTTTPCAQTGLLGVSQGLEIPLMDLQQML